jgi:hypothetical protein
MIRHCVPLSLFCAISMGQSLTPRELFYTPVKKVAAVQPAVKTVPTAKKKQKAAQVKPPVENAPPQSALVPAAYAPLGLRYSLLHSSNGSAYNEVDAETVFRSGDKLKVTAQSNESAYLYVISRGSSGNWIVLFPTSEVGGGDNKVAAMQSNEIPPADGRFSFDETPGEEKLFIVLSRTPVENLESLIYDLRKAPKQAAPEKELLLAQRIAPIDDALVGRLRAGVMARDLVFEKVDEKTAGERKEKAVYVVNTKSSPDARLVVDLTLKHR